MFTKTNATQHPALTPAAATTTPVIAPVTAAPTATGAPTPGPLPITPVLPPAVPAASGPLDPANEISTQLLLLTRTATILRMPVLNGNDPALEWTMARLPEWAARVMAHIPVGTPI